MHATLAAAAAITTPGAPPLTAAAYAAVGALGGAILALALASILYSSRAAAGIDAFIADQLEARHLDQLISDAEFDARRRHPVGKALRPGDPLPTRAVDVPTQRVYNVDENGGL